MRTLTTISFFFISVFVFGQASEKPVGKPNTLEETYKYLDQMFDDTAKYDFMTLPEEVATGRLHHGFGMWMRNNWELWRGGKLNQYFLDKGVEYPDIMTAIILTSYHKHLNNRPVDLEGQIKQYRNYYSNIAQQTSLVSFIPDSAQYITTDSTLLYFFPIGDTTLVSINASYKKLLTTYASSINAIAVVKEHRKNKLLIQIIKMETAPKKKCERKIGDIYEISPQNCTLLPPRDWTQNKKESIAAKGKLE